MLNELIEKRRTVKAKCCHEVEHFQLKMTSISMCEPGEMPDNPCTLTGGEDCPECGKPIEVLDETEEIEQSPGDADD